MARASDHLLAVSWVMVFGDVVLERRLKRHLYISQLAWEHLGVCVCVCVPEELQEVAREREI